MILTINKTNTFDDKVGIFTIKITTKKSYLQNEFQKHVNV